MRVKKIKNASKESLLKLNTIIIEKELNLTNIQELKANFENLTNIKNYEKIILEIGSGKGKFITTYAKDYPKYLFLAVEKDLTTCYLLANTINDANLKNVFCLNSDAINLKSILNESMIDELYLNFSDPWPKKRHHKRRLTAASYLDLYQYLLKKNAFLNLRTDHLDFFNDSIEYFENSRFLNVEKIDYDFAQSSYMTEYEIRKRKEFKINNVKCTLKKTEDKNEKIA